MRLRCSLTILFVLVVSPFFSVTSVDAQDGGQELCPQFVPDVISELGTNCANHLVGEVCYGYELVEAMPVPGLTFPDGSFDEAGDRLPVTDVALVSTSGLDVDADPPTWGFALIKINAYTGMNEETGEPETTELLYIVPGGVTIEAVNEPQYDDNGTLLLGEVDGVEYLAPLQEVFIRNLYEAPMCADAIPSFLIVQGPPGEAIDIVVNGAVIRVEGTIVLEILPDADLETGEFLRVTTLFGMVTLNPDTPSALLVPPGFFSQLNLADAEDIGLDNIENDQPVEGVDWSAPQQLTQNGLDRMALLETFPDNIVELIDVPVLIVASGAGGPQPQFVFENPQALALAQEACAATPPLLPEAICDFLF